MKGRSFLDLARRLGTGAAEVDWRAAMIHAYYALVLECRDALVRWGFRVPRVNMHPDVRLRFTYSSHPEVKQIGDHLDELVRYRNQANYDLRPAAIFASAVRATKMIRRAADGLALLDGLESDPGRRAAAVASIRP